MKTMQLILLVLVTGCGASTTTQELLSARTLMAKARGGETARRNPDELRVAERALNVAEAAHEDDPGSVLERDTAYVADRRIRIAMAHAGRSAAAENARGEQAEYTEQLEQTAQAQHTEIADTHTELDRTRNQAAAGAEQLQTTTNTLRTRDRQLTNEREARAATEAQLALTMTELNAVASVRQEQEDMIITLSGGVLFGNGQSILLGDAERRLAAVVSVIRSHPDRSVVVVGHTDSSGSSTTNQQLSLARANVVRDRLVLGVPAARIEARGMGEAQPVANNNSAEGRASNRRVEIIVHRNGPVASL